MRVEPQEPELASGWIEDDVAEEFPELTLRWTWVEGRARRSPKAVKRRLVDLSDAVSGREAVILRNRPIAAAYRVFERQVGLDPDVDRGPLENALLDRLLRGEFQTDGLPADACKIAAVETGVPVWAIDAATLVGTLGICAVQPGELLGRGEEAIPIETGRLAVGDLQGPVAVLFSGPGPGVGPTRRTQTIALFAVGVEGVLEPLVDEALEIAAAICLEPAA